VAVAESVKGVVTCALLVGVVTLMAQAGATTKGNVRRRQEVVFIVPFHGVSPSARVQA